MHLLNCSGKAAAIVAVMTAAVFSGVSCGTLEMNPADVFPVIATESSPAEALTGFVEGPDAASPGVAVSVIRGGETVYRAVAGVRRDGSPEPIALDDRFHIGSNTKAVTALLCGILVDRGFLSWTSTVGDVLGPETTMRDEYRSVTLEQLLSHTAGLPAELPLLEWLSFFPYDSAKGMDRPRMAGAALRTRAAGAPGAAFLYSNLGYVVAGHMAELAGGRDWESLVRDELFAPLGMDGAGFGPPAKGNPGPWGHSPAPVDPSSREADNPAALGPAGTVHASLYDLERYLSLYIDGGKRPDADALVSEAGLSEIMRPRIDGYGLGWVIIQPEEGPRFLYHDGCNTSFYSSLVVFPEAGDAVIVLANRGDDRAGAAVGQHVDYLARRFLAPGAPGEGPRQ